MIVIARFRVLTLTGIGGSANLDGLNDAKF
jgi:hypothetical protein